MAATATVHLDSYRRSRRAAVGEELSFADISELCAFVQHEIVASKLKYNAIAQRAGCCASTVGKMASGETHLPRASTVLMILGVLGFEIVARRTAGHA